MALICLKLSSGAKKKKNRTPKQKFLKKCHVEGRNEIWPKNDEPLTESHMLTHVQLNSSTNLSETEFWHKEKRALKQKLKKMQFRRSKR